MMRLLIIALLLASCAPSVYRVARPRGDSPQVDCVELMDRRDGAALAGKILSGIGGVSALVTAPDSMPENARWGIGAGAASIAIVGVSLVWYADRMSDRFDDFCEVVEVPILDADGGAE